MRHTKNPFKHQLIYRCLLYITGGPVFTPSCYKTHPSICTSQKWDRNILHSTVFAGMWVIWLHKFDSYRIINVEMQMKRGHLSAFVGASLLFLYMPELVGRISRAARAQIEQIEQRRRSGRTLHCVLKHGLSAWVTQSLLLTKTKQNIFFFFVGTEAAFMKVINTN